MSAWRQAPADGGSSQGEAGPPAWEEGRVLGPEAAALWLRQLGDRAGVDALPKAGGAGYGSMLMSVVHEKLYMLAANHRRKLLYCLPQAK